MTTTAGGPCGGGAAGLLLHPATATKVIPRHAKDKSFIITLLEGGQPQTGRRPEAPKHQGSLFLGSVRGRGSPALPPHPARRARRTALPSREGGSFIYGRYARGGVKGRGRVSSSPKL